MQTGSRRSCRLADSPRPARCCCPADSAYSVEVMTIGQTAVCVPKNGVEEVTATDTGCTQSAFVSHIHWGSLEPPPEPPPGPLVPPPTNGQWGHIQGRPGTVRSATTCLSSTRIAGSDADSQGWRHQLVEATEEPGSPQLGGGHRGKCQRAPRAAAADNWATHSSGRAARHSRMRPPRRTPGLARQPEVVKPSACAVARAGTDRLRRRLEVRRTVLRLLQVSSW